MSKNIIIYGFGRMGLTHYAILNQLVDDAIVTFVDPDKKVNYFAKKNINAKIFNVDSSIKDNIDIALICTPPMFHIPILRKCLNQNISNVFVEKPFGGINDEFDDLSDHFNKISIGYVLRFNPIIQKVKELLINKEVVSVEGCYFSNTLEKKPSGWRNSIYSGVTNEVGAHIIDLCVYLFNLKNPNLKNIHKKSIVSDVDDIVISEFTENNITYKFHFDWVNKNYRKPVFKFNISFSDGSSIYFDQQKINIFNNNILINSISTVDLSCNVPFYLRGVDFTKQMQDFIGSKLIIANVEEAIITRKIIQTLISK